MNSNYEDTAFDVRDGTLSYKYKEICGKIVFKKVRCGLLVETDIGRQSPLV